MTKTLFVLLTLVLIYLTIAARQDQRPNGTRAVSSSEQSRAAEPDQDIPNLPDEVRLRMKREREEAEHRKIVDGAKQLLDTSVDIAKGYRNAKSLNGDAFKRISTVEKLARRILSHAGGEVVEPKEHEAEVQSVPDAIDRMILAAESIKKRLTSETRYVVSAALIADSNQVIYLAQYLRRGQKHDN